MYDMDLKTHFFLSKNCLTKLVLTCLLIVVNFKILTAQKPIGTWATHFDYKKGQDVVVVNNRIFYAAQSGLIAYDIVNKKYLKIELADGISSVNIGQMEYDVATKTLILAHKNGAIDLLKLDNDSKIENIINLPAIKNNNAILGSKLPNSIFIENKMAYLSTDFGLVFLDLSKNIIQDVAINLANNGSNLQVWNTIIIENKFILATPEGFKVADLNKNLLDFNNYSLYQKEIKTEGKKCFVGKTGKVIHLIVNQKNIWNFENEKQIALQNFDENALDVEFKPDGFFVLTESKILEYDPSLKVKTLYQNNFGQMNKFNIANNLFWVAHKQLGLFSYGNSTYTNVTPNADLGVLSSRNDTLFVDNAGIQYATQGVFGGLLVKSKTGSTKFFYNIPLNDADLSITSSTINSLAFDTQLGLLFLATSKGVVGLYPMPDLLSANDLNKFIYTPRLADGSRSLKDENVTALAIDGGNRKWVGTSAGLLLLNEDFSKIIYKFNTQNSPLPSNNINFLNYKGDTGDLFIYTNQGAVSFRTEATDGSQSQGKNVIVFPNPVRPNYDGVLAVSGLVNNANFKIVNAAGAVVFTGRANGGTATWNMLTNKGIKAQSGVYFVFSANDLGQEAQVTKFLMIK